MDECKKAWDEYLWPDVDYCMTKGSWEIWQAAWNAKPVAAEVPVTSVEEAKPSVVRGRRCRECGGCETVTHADGVTACYWCQAPQPIHAFLLRGVK